MGLIEFENAKIWNSPVVERNQTDPGEVQAHVEQKSEDVDKYVKTQRAFSSLRRWVRDLYLQDKRVHTAVEEGIRTTDLTDQYFKEVPTPTSPSDPSAASASSQGKKPDNRLFPTFDDVRKIRQREYGIQTLPPQVSAPPTGPSRVPVITQNGSNRGYGAAQFSSQQLGQNRDGQIPRLEGPAHDTRGLNDGDRLAREHPRDPTDAYLFPVRAKERPQAHKDKVIDMESRILGADRHHIVAIADLTGTHMKFPHDEPQDWADARKTGRINRIRIWGTREAVERAKIYLMYLNKHADKDVQSSTKKILGWAKVKAIPDKRHRDFTTKLEKEREEKSRFRSPHSPEEIFPYTGAFAWPQKEVNPGDVLGMNYESLDPIRLELEVYIVYSSKRQCFRILGYDHESIQKALDRIYFVFCEIAARNRPQIQYTIVSPPPKFLPQVFLDKDHGMDDLLEPYKPAPDSVGVECCLADDGTMPHDANWEARSKILRLANECYIKSALDGCLKDVFYLRMYAKLRVYFGTLILFGYKRPKFSRHGLEEYIDMMRAKLSRGELIRHFGSNAIGERLKDYCETRTDVFNPANPYEGDEDGNITMDPSYSSSMYIMVMRKPDPPVEVKLEVEFEKAPKGKYRVSARRWLRIPRTDAPGSSQVIRKRMPLDLKMVDLEYGIAYQFDLTLGQALPDLEKMPILTEFVLHLDLVDSRDGKTKRVSYITLPGIRVVSIITKKKYPYFFTGTPYIFEVTQYEHIRGKDDTIRRRTPLNDGGFPADYSHHSTTDILWGVSLYNSDWDATFAKQQDLPIGCTGDWKASVEEFLASTGRKIHTHGPKGMNNETGGHGQDDGFTGLNHKIQFCLKVISEIKKKILGDKSKKFIDAVGERAAAPPPPPQPQDQQPRSMPHGVTRRALEKQPEQLIDTRVAERTNAYTYNDDLETIGDEDGDIYEPEEDTYARIPYAGRTQAARERLASKKATGKAKTASTYPSSAYGDSEFSELAKERAGLNSDNSSKYGDSEYSKAAKERDGLVGSDTASRYGDSEFSREDKERTGMI
ncbi:hypothetical protein ABW20_dc0100967 [Dactylellina cionopaga]|nr:hypothetical protein ABW20_dc0100967 [Dactylellina cionopaga]